MKMWSFHSDCQNIVQEVWNERFVGCPMVILSKKLQALKLKLKVWNKSIFGDVNLNVKSAMQKLDSVQQQIDVHNHSDALFELEKNAQVDLEKALHFQEVFWQEKARLNWHLQGDMNTQFFHKMVKVRNVTKQMSMLKHDGEIISSTSQIENHVVSYFEGIFNTENNCSPNDLIELVIPNIVSQEDNLMLTKLPSVDEIRKAVFAMNSVGAPGSDGFGAFSFFKDIGIL